MTQENNLIIEAYNTNAQDYDLWFDKHPQAYASELAAIKQLLPQGKGLEIGAGGGRFAKPLGITDGLEPSAEMRKVAAERGLNFVEGYAEDLPYPDKNFDFALFVTSICFVKDIKKSLSEATRVIKDAGKILIAFIEKTSPLGQEYEKHKEQSPYYKYATFYSAEELETILKELGFANFEYRQTLFADMPQDDVHPVRSGRNEGAFIILAASR